MSLKIEQNKTFTHAVVNLDNVSFRGCKFVRCQVIYSGEPFDAIDCDWTDNKFLLTGAACRTAAFFSDMGWLKTGIPVSSTFLDENPS